MAVLTTLLDGGAEPDEETDEGMTALMFAAWRVHDDAVALLERVRARTRGRCTARPR
ncbi:MAG TPA: hypothetical protein VFW65_11040 [Pseudonocardiaceae bacterium]|nr:hypothetical protein [Pseudonocardiaceae bacterium]